MLDKNFKYRCKELDDDLYRVFNVPRRKDAPSPGHEPFRESSSMYMFICLYTDVSSFTSKICKILIKLQDRESDFSRRGDSTGHRNNRVAPASASTRRTVH